MKKFFMGGSHVHPRILGLSRVININDETMHIDEFTIRALNLNPKF